MPKLVRASKNLEKLLVIHTGRDDTRDARDDTQVQTAENHNLLIDVVLHAGRQAKTDVGSIGNCQGDAWPNPNATVLEAEGRYGCGGDVGCSPR